MAQTCLTNLVHSCPPYHSDSWLPIKVITLVVNLSNDVSSRPQPLRLASPRDILRIGVVAASGFRYSPIFDWERPYREKYPEDTPLSYRQAFASVIKNSEYAVLVALDKYESDEATKSKAIIPPNNGAEIPAEGDEVLLERLVGSWRWGRGGLGNSKMTDFTNCAQMEGRASNFCIQVHTQSCHRISIATRTQVTATFLPKVLKPLRRSSFTTPGDRCFSC